MYPLHRTAQGHAMPWRWSLLVACALTLLMLGVTALYWQAQERQAAEKVSQDFQRTANRMAHDIENRMEAYELVLRGVKGFFDSAENITAKEFSIYVETLSLESSKPGLQGVSMIQWINSLAWAAPSAPLGGGIFPGGTRAHYAPIAYIEPMTPENQKALGLDIATRPASWEAMELTRDNGQPALTRGLVLIQDKDNASSASAQTPNSAPVPTGVVMYLPLYAYHAPLATLAQRRAALRGWVSVQFRMRALMQGLRERLDADIDLRIYDGELLNAQNLLYSTLTATQYQPPTALQTTRQLVLGGRIWTLLMAPRADFIAEHSRSGHNWIAAMGALGSLLLGLLTWLLLTRREHGVALARNLAEHKLTYYDALTGLPNRALLQERVRSAITLHQRLGQMGALIFLDLDNFKQINDARGHSAGDALLVQVAQRLSHLLRSEDTLARLGGDEFALLLHDLSCDRETATAAALRIGDQVRSVLEVPHRLGQDLYSSSASIGITLFPKTLGAAHAQSTQSADDLLREADTAMSLAKKMQHNRMRLFEDIMLIDAQENLSLEQDIKSALERGEISLYVQSQVDAASRTVVGGELLLRWNHPLRGSVSPIRFISVAEESGLILRLGDWVIVQACQALAQLQATRPQLTLSVNVSPRQFHQEDFVERIRSILSQTGAPPTRLILEITETLLVNSRDTIARMSELVQMGVRFSVDDFGTGYSSLSYLKQLPLFELKIDKSFVNDIPHNPDDTAIAQAILAMALHLKLRVVAEGVETAAQADFLQAHHCDDLQGYLFERPMLMQSWLDKHGGASAAL